MLVTSGFEGGGTDDPLVIQWREEGGPPVKPPERTGFGTRLIQRVVARALRADVAVQYRPEGLICRMTVPWPIIEAGPPDSVAQQRTQ